MSRVLIGSRSIVMLMLVFSCGDPMASDDDGTGVHDETCWGGYNDPAMSSGSVEAGPALQQNEPFQPFQDPPGIQLFLGVQGGHHVFLSAQIDGLNPGSADASDSKSINPRTLFNVYRTNGDKVNLNSCPVIRAYQPADSKYQLGGWRTIFDEKLIPEIYGEEVRLVAEVLDCDGRYAYYERMVTVLAPVE